MGSVLFPLIPINGVYCLKRVFDAAREEIDRSVRMVRLSSTVDSRYLEIEGTSKQFEISVLRHIRFVVLRKKTI